MRAAQAITKQPVLFRLGGFSGGFFVGFGVTAILEMVAGNGGGVES